MISAYLLARVKPNKDREVLQKLRMLRPVREAATLYGEYDIIAKLQVETLEDLDIFIFDTVRTIAGIDATTTLITTEIPEARPETRK